MDKILIDSSAVAYHFMVHTFNKNYNARFSDVSLQNFVDDFCQFAKLEGFGIEDKNQQPLLCKQIFEDIMDNYVCHSSDFYGNEFAYFREDKIKQMRLAYQNSTERYKNIVVSFEEMLVRCLYKEKINYLMFEKCYKEDAQKYNKEEEKIPMA